MKNVQIPYDLFVRWWSITSAMMTIMKMKSGRD